MPHGPTVKGALKSALALAVSCVAVGAAARTPHSPTVTLGSTVPPPRGYVDMCGEYRTICGVLEGTSSGGSDASMAPVNAPLDFQVGDVKTVFGPRHGGLDCTDAAAFAIDPDWTETATGLGQDPRADATACGASSTSIRWLDRAGLFTPLNAGNPVHPDAVAAPPPTAPIVAEQTRNESRLIERINLTVNRGTTQRSDRDIYAIDEVWYPSGGGRGAVGDCEDMALEKKLRLIKAGFPTDRLMLAVVYSRAAGLHTVLIARLQRGDVVLDSRRDRIVRWDAAAYRWMSVQSPDSPRQWRAVQL